MKIDRIKNTAISVVLIIFMVICFANQNKISDAVLSSLYRCVTGIIPSLFAVTVLSSIMQKCSVIERLMPFKRGSNVLSCFIFGNLCGYPVGAKVISDMLNDNKLSKNEAESIMCFSFSCGPVFSLLASRMIYGNSICGLVSFVSILISNLILYMAYVIKNRGYGTSDYKTDSFSSKIVISSVTDAANTMLVISSTIAAFSVISKVIECSIPLLPIKSLSSLLEISNILELRHIPLYLTTILISFGGLCVQMQLISIVDSRFKLYKYFLSRLIQIPLSAIISLILDLIFNFSDSISATTNKVYLSEANSIIPFLCMMAMISIVFMTKIKQRTD